MFSGNESLNNYTLRGFNNYDLIGSLIVCYHNPQLLKQFFLYIFLRFFWHFNWFLYLFKFSCQKKLFFIQYFKYTHTVPHFHGSRESQSNSIASQRSVYVENHHKQNIQLLHYRHLAVVYKVVIFREGRG